MKKPKFIKAAFKDHRVAALTPSSKYTVKAITKRIKQECRYVVEYGAGDGVITKKILPLLPADGKLVAIELNPELLDELRAIKDPKLSIVNGDVVTHSVDFKKLGLPSVDLVVSGIPFSFLKPKMRKLLIENTYHNLAPHGMFLVYQFSPLVLPILKKHFRKVKLYYEVRNLFPYFIMVAEK